VACPAVIALATFKGGSGKSTIAACLAAYWHTKGGNPALLDADPHGNIVKWLAREDRAAALRIEADATEGLRQTIPKLAKDHRPVIVDTPGFRSRATTAALASAELALIPVKPSPIDVGIALETQRLVDELNSKERVDRPILVRFVLTMTTSGSVIARHIRAQMTDAGLPLLAAEIGNRVAYGEAALIGLTPTLNEPTGAAARDIRRLAAEIESLG
jgi:chromosome partitioning protein